jgi:hypothetical protein
MTSKVEGNPGSLSNPPEILLFSKVINLIPKGGVAPLEIHIFKIKIPMMC